MKKFRYKDGEFEAAPTIFRGSVGIHAGRLRPLLLQRQHPFAAWRHHLRRLSAAQSALSAPRGHERQHRGGRSGLARARDARRHERRSAGTRELKRRQAVQVHGGVRTVDLPRRSVARAVRQRVRCGAGRKSRPAQGADRGERYASSAATRTRGPTSSPRPTSASAQSTSTPVRTARSTSSTCIAASSSITA